MIKRFAAHFAFILLFAFTQIGAVTHEISHFSDFAKHGQQDKNSQTEQCKQCIGYAEVANGLLSQAPVLAANNAEFIASSSYHFNFQTQLNSPYSARAPPQIL